MLTLFSRIIHYGWTNFWRNGWPSAATVAVMILALLVFFSLIMFNVVTGSAVASLQNKIDIGVYFKTNVPEDTVLAIKQSFETLSQVREVEYVSRDKALENFRARHADDPVISETLTELGENPLEASLNVKAKEPSQYSAIAEYLNAQNLKQYFDTVTYYENQVVIDRLVKIVNYVNRGGLLLTVFLAAIAGLVVFNTILLAIYSVREEIGIMRSVGASNLLVRGPFIVEGVVAGLIAAAVSMVIAAPLVYIGSPYIEVLIPGLNIFRHFYTNLFSLIGYQVLFGVAIGAFSSSVAVRRYLKN